MPYIPLPTKSAPLPDVPGPVLDRERRPTVDTRGQQQAIGDLAKAGKMPDLPMSLADNSGMVAIGKAIAQTGDVMGALAIKRQEAETRVQVANAANEMQNFMTEFDGWRETNPNVSPGEWNTELSNRLGPLRQKILEGKNYSPMARQAIEERLQLFQTSAQTEVRVAADKEIFGRARKAVEGELTNAIALQAPDRFKSALADGVASGFLSKQGAEAFEIKYKEEGERQQKQAKADADRIEFEVKAGDAIADPLKWKKENSEPWKGKELLWQKVKNVADERAREGTTEAVNQLTDAVVTGDLTWPTEVDAWESPYLTPELREQVKHYLTTRNAYTEKLDREENGVKNAVELRHAIANIDPEEDVDRRQYFTLASEINTRVPEELRGDLRATLASRYGAKEAPEIKDQISKTISVFFDPKDGAIPYRKKEFVTVKHGSDEGRWFGQDRYKKGDPVIDAETGKPKVVTDKSGNERFTWVTDRDAELRAIQAETIVRKKMEDWRKANPDKANDPAAVQKALQDTLPEGMAAGMFQKLQERLAPRAAAQGRVTSYGYADDSTPDSNSKVGIGAFVPDSEAEKIKRGENSRYKLREGDIAVSPDVEKAFRVSGVKPGDEVLVQLANGEVHRVRWMDRTAQDEDILAGKVKGVTQPLRGRFDFYSPNGKHRNDGVQVVKWWVPEKMPSIPASNVTAKH